MKFLPTQISGVWLVDVEPDGDMRGFLARAYCEREFAERGLCTRWVQCNLSLTKSRGMLRGMHYQASPKTETKLVRCVQGAVYDVVIDVRPTSPTYGRWQGFELTRQNRRALYIPGEIAHGFQCLTDDCELFYQMSEFYYPELARGIHWDDKTLKIAWPIPNPVFSLRDGQLDSFLPLTNGIK